MLKHLTRIEVKNFYLGKTGWSLFDPNGDPVQAFDRYARHIVQQSYSYSTRKRYSEAAAKFIDYLWEIGVLGSETATTTNYEINRAIEAYPFFLRDAGRFDDVDATRAKQLCEYAQIIKFEQGLAAKSFTPVLAAINLLLLIAQDLANEAIALTKQNGDDWTGADISVLINAINGLNAVSRFEKRRLQQNSLLGSVIRLRGELKRPRKIPAPVRTNGQTDVETLDFPIEFVPKLLEATTCQRDRALYCLLAASGIRLHEALNLQLDDIDAERSEIFVLDPEHRRLGQQSSRVEKQRFKGRSVARTVLFEPLKSEFFRSYAEYLRLEFVATSEHNFVFQYVDKKRRGRPLHLASYAALEKSFRKTVLRAQIPGPSVAPERVWTPHSLRHMYGVYMLNHVPHDEGYGLRLSQVQMLMGHRDINSTKLYARADRAVLDARIKAADEIILDKFEEFNLNLPAICGGETKQLD